MYLKSLELGGFKSFAKKENLEFSTPITAIVGPNGSGKSNVAEAFRFVLGEQSFKSMRGKRGEDLIWGGSPNIARSNRASVRVVLNNEKRVLPIDYDEVSIERTVLRDGVNEYSINGSRTRLKDVQELLAAANIGPSGHHIISQGEADRILSSSPKERREMIEDALGLKVFQYKKAESERKLKRTEENIAHVESLRKENAPHLKFLERQVKKIEKSLELREELKGVYQEYLKREEVYLTHTEKELTERKREPQQKLDALAKDLARVKETLTSGEKDEKRSKLVELEKKLRTVREERQKTLRENGRAEGQISYLERLVAEAERKREREEERQVPYVRVASLVGEIERSVSEKEHSDDVTELKRVLTGVLGSLRSFLRSVRSSGSDDSAQHQDELTKLKQEKASYDASLAEIAQEEEKLENAYTELRTAIDSEESSSRQAEREMFEIMNTQRELEQKLHATEQELQTLERDKEEFKRELREGVALLGNYISGYSDFKITNSRGDQVKGEDILREERDRQRDRRRELEKMKIRLEELGGSGAEDIMKEYEEVRSRDEFLGREIDDLTASVEKLQGLIDDLTAQLNEQFISGIEKIDTEFNRFFVLMFNGGSAALKRVAPKQKKKTSDLEDVLGVEDEMLAGSEEEVQETEEGIEIDVKLPNKRIKGLEMLSGGERALTSIALIFAMSQVNPPLFVILDETDAALDEANSRRYGDMIESLAKKSQLILITHNRETMSRAGVLYGITMGGDGVSKVLSVRFDEAVAVAK